MSLSFKAFISFGVPGKMHFPPSRMKMWKDGELHGKRGSDGMCHTALFFPLLSSYFSPLSFCSCSKLPVGLKEEETMQLHVNLLVGGSGHVTTNCELIFHVPESFGRLLPVSDLLSGF